LDGGVVLVVVNVNTPSGEKKEVEREAGLTRGERKVGGTVEGFGSVCSVCC
jgi:hypothetical protein